jgi:hypothetical protein
VRFLGQVEEVRFLGKLRRIAFLAQHLPQGPGSATSWGVNLKGVHKVSQSHGQAADPEDVLCRSSVRARVVIPS